MYANPLLCLCNIFLIKKFDDLGIICEDFFLFRDIERPTKMDIYNQEYERERVDIFSKKCICNYKDNGYFNFIVWKFTKIREGRNL